MAEVLTGARHRQELVNVIREVRQPVADEAAAARRHHHRRRRACWRSRSRPTACRPPSSARRRSRASASRRSRSSRRSLAFWLRPPAAQACHRHAGRALRRGARAVAAGGDSERRRRRRAGTGSATEDVPPVIVDRMVEQAVEKCRTIEGGKTVGRSRLKRYARRARRRSRGLAILLLIVGPEFLRQGASALLDAVDAARKPPARTPSPSTPGDATVPQGIGSDDQRQARRLPIERRRADGEAGRRSRSSSACRSSRPATPTTFEGMLFDVKKPIEYYVEADGVRSPTYTMKVVELPAVAKLELEYVFPAYTGLPPQKVEVGRRRRGAARHRSARARSRRRWRRRPGGCSSTRARRPALDARKRTGRSPAASRSTRTASTTSSWTARTARRSTASPKYTIDVIEDQPPTVTFEKPKRDTSGESGRRSVRAGARRRRLRREAAGSDLLGERRRRRRR